MTTIDTTATEYRNLPLALLTESTTNPRRIFDEAGLQELAASIRTHGVLEPLPVRPRNERSFEIVAGARRFRAAKLADADAVPVRIRNFTDAEALEAQLIENLQRRDVHPLDEAQGCSKRTGHNKLLFADVRQDACSDPASYSAKLDVHVKRAIVAKPKLVQISTAYSGQHEGSTALPRNKYIVIRQDKPERKEQREWPEYKTCKFVTEAIVTEGTEKGETRKVCANPDCPVHHPKKQQRRTDADAATRAAQDKQRREEAIANTTGIRVLAAIADAVPVRLMKRDLLFVLERLAGLVDERRLEIVARQHGIKREKDSDSMAKLFAAYLRRAEESVLGSVLVELTVLLTAAHRQTAQVLNEAAAVYKVDTDAIVAKVKQEFAAKDKANAAKKAAPKPPAKQQAKAAKKSAAA